MIGVICDELMMQHYLPNGMVRLAGFQACLGVSSS